MFYIHTCNPHVSSSTLATAHTQSEAFKLASNLLAQTDPYDTYVADTSTGCSRIIGFGSTGFIPETPDPTDPCTRGGSVLFGRETE